MVLIPSVSTYTSLRSAISFERLGACEVLPCLSGKSCLFDPKNPDASRNCDQAVALQTRHFKIEIVPSELRVTSHQGVEVTIRGSSEKFEDAFSDGLW